MPKILDALNRRYAVKKFDPSKKVAETDIQELVDAFVLTPSSFGLQPWKLLYVEDRETRKAMASFCRNDSQIVDSSGVFVLTRTTDISDNLVDKFIDVIVAKKWTPKEYLKDYEAMMKRFLANLNTTEKQHWAEKQVMIALGNMLTVCALKKIDACPIEWFQKDKIDEILGLKEKWLASVVLLPIGYRDEDDEHLKKWKIRYGKDTIFERV